MYKNILLPVALEHNNNVNKAVSIAQKLLDDDGQITAVHVIEAIPEFASAHLPDNYQEKRQTEAMAALKAQLEGVNDFKAMVVTGHAGRSILDFAEQHGNDCIIIASHQPGFQDFFLGSTAARVVRHAKCAVHVIR